MLAKEDFQEFFQVLGHRWIIGGDFNAKNLEWGSKVIDPRGRELLKATKAVNGAFLSGGEPIYRPSDQRRILTYWILIHAKISPATLRKSKIS